MKQKKNSKKILTEINFPKKSYFNIKIMKIYIDGRLKTHIKEYKIQGLSRKMKLKNFFFIHIFNMILNSKLKLTLC